MALTFITSGTAQVGVPVHVTVYEGGMALNPATSSVIWSFDAGAGAVAVAADTTGYTFTFPIPTPVARTWAANASMGVFSGTIQFTVTAVLQFTMP